MNSSKNVKKNIHDKRTYVCQKNQKLRTYVQSTWGKLAKEHVKNFNFY